MKKKLRLEATLVAVLVLISFSKPLAQVQTARFISTSGNSHGFYEYLPQGYSSGSTSYPLIVFFHGLGELGNGVSQLPRVLANGPPKLIADGRFPVSFITGSSTYRFIVISPQFVNWPTPTDMDAVIEYAIRNYRVDRNRIYLTGLSMGGGSVWDYAGNNSTFASKIAAIVPISGASYPDRTRAQVIARANLPVWATHNQGDETVPVFYTNDYVTYINSNIPPPSPLAKKTIFPVTGHDAWTRTYDPAFTENGMNIYQYMLQFQRNAVALPVLLGDYKLILNNNSEVVVKWNTTSEINNKNFLVERSADGNNFSVVEDVTAANNLSGHDYEVTDKRPLPGNNFYRLVQIDIDGKTTYFSILKVVVPVSSNQQYFQLMPNPVVNSMKIEMLNPSKGTLQVILSDIQGQQLRTWNFQKLNPYWEQSIDITGIPKGNYILQVKGNNISEVKRFIKQ